MARTMPPSKMGSTAPERIMRPRAAPSRATQGVAERPAGRWARRSRATKAQGSQAAGLDQIEVDALGRHEAAEGEGGRRPGPRPARTDRGPGAAPATPAAATTSTAIWLRTQARAPGRTAKRAVVG